VRDDSVCLLAFALSLTYEWFCPQYWMAFQNSCPNFRA
jgi:hypothetical protein